MAALAACLAQNNALWKDFNEAVRLAFRAQAFPDIFIKQYFEALQTAINRERGQNRNMVRQQQVQNRAQPVIRQGNFHMQPNPHIDGQRHSFK